MSAATLAPEERKAATYDGTLDALHLMGELMGYATRELEGGDAEERERLAVLEGRFRLAVKEVAGLGVRRAEAPGESGAMLQLNNGVED